MLPPGGGEYSVTGGGYAPYGSIATVEGEVIHETTQATTRPILVPGSVDCEAAPPLGASLEAVLRAGLLCNDSSLYQEAGRWHIHGDPTEGALLVSAAKAGLNREYVDHCYPRLDTIPFESEHQYMATLHRMGDGAGGGCIAFVKGAVEKVVARSAVELQEDGSTVPIEPVRLENAAREMAAQGLRVLAFAQKEFPADTTEITRSQVKDGLVFLGLQSMLDPPRQEALEAVAACHNAGIQVKMITGDHALTAVAIGRRLNLGKPGCAIADEVKAVTGIELAALADDTIAETIENTYVFARVTPEQKLRLVNVLQSQGHVVAMTGDGVNDAPALRQADIGVAMGITGTEVAKEAADMILTDDNFASIEAAVEEGRGVFDNLTKFITWTLPTNVGEGLVVLAAIFAGVALPITPVQILWINMTTAVLLGLMLAFEPGEKDVMNYPTSAPLPPSTSAR